MTADLRHRIAVAMSRDGKPRGDHMIEAYAMTSKAAAASSTRKDQQMEGVYDCASRCIANETAMYQGLLDLMPEVIAALADGPQWRSMDDAPRDGAVIIAMCRYTEASAGFPDFVQFNRGHWRKVGKGNNPPMVCWAWMPRRVLGPWPSEVSA